MTIDINKLCVFPKCGLVKKAKGYCPGHYLQLRSGKELTPLRPKRPKTCTSPGCSKPHQALGFCDEHYRELPEFKERKMSYMKEYNSRPEVKLKKHEYMVEWYANPENKEHAKAQASEWYFENIEYVAERRAKPENVLKQKEYDKHRNSLPEAKKVAKERNQLPENVAKAKVRYNIPENKKRKQAVAKIRKNVRLETDVEFRLSETLRTRHRCAIRKVRAGKFSSAVRDLGCTLSELKTYIESLFSTGMSWSNYGIKKDQWSLDHVRPFASFNLKDPEQQRQAAHYTNLQPLWHKDNLSKGAKWNG